MSTSSALVRDLEKIVLPRGWYLHREGRHRIYRHPDGGQVVVNSSKVSGKSRTMNNVLAAFRRAERRAEQRGNY